MTKEMDLRENLGRLQQSIEKREKEVVCLIRERVREQKEDWQAIGNQLLEWNDSADFRFLIREKQLLPLMINENSEYLFVDLETGELKERVGSWWNYDLAPAEDKAVLRAQRHPERLEATRVREELEIVESLRDKWAFWVRYRMERTPAKYVVGRELTLWMIVHRLVAWDFQDPGQLQGIDLAIRALGIDLEPVYNCRFGTALEIHKLLELDVLSLTSDRRLTLAR